MNNQHVNQFSVYADRIKRSPWVSVIFLVFLVLFLVSLGLSVEDFTTSLRGYEEWPTAKANAWVIYLVAILPQLGQIAFSYAFFDRGNAGYLLIGLLFFAWDLTTDVYYKSYKFQSERLVMMSIFESIPLYTLGSECLVAFSLGMLRAIWPHVLAPKMKVSKPVQPQYGQPFAKAGSGFSQQQYRPMSSENKGQGHPSGH